MTKDEAFTRLARSRFRSRFRLTEKDRLYIKEKGIETMRRHARDFVQQRLMPPYPENDGHQTPMKGHPVFKAMHATALCCRGCMEKWWKVKRGVALTETQQQKMVDLLLAWIERQMQQGM